MGVPAAALSHELVGLDDVLGGAGSRLYDEVATPRGWAARFAALDRSLLGLAAARSDSWLSGDQTLRRAWRQLHTTRGTQPVAQLAAEAGSIRSQLGRLAGLPPTGWLAAERPFHEAG